VSSPGRLREQLDKILRLHLLAAGKQSAELLYPRGVERARLGELREELLRNSRTCTRLPGS